MKAVLLAAGLGTRLRPLTDRLPKCLVPINQRPLLDYWLDQLTSCPEIDDIFINLHYRADFVTDHLNQHWSAFPQIKTWYESALLGTAGTLRKNFHQLKGEACLVIHADNFSVFDLHDFISKHEQKTNAITMMLFETDQPELCGIVQLDALDRVIAMYEKQKNPPGNLANGAVYIMNPEVLVHISENELQDISTEVIPRFLGNIGSWQNRQYHRDIGTPESYERANIDARKMSTNVPAS